MRKTRTLIITAILVTVLGLLTFSLAFAGDTGPDASDAASDFGAVQNVPLSEGGGTMCAGGGGATGIIHDDGGFENGYSGNPALVSTFEIYNLFTPVDPTYDYTRFCVALVALQGTDLNFEIVFRANNGGTPGNELASVAANATGLPGGLPCGWYEYDLTGVGGLPTGANGDIWIGVRYNPQTYPSRFTCADESDTTPLHPGFVNFNTGSGWQAIQSVFTGYNAMSTRVEMSPGGPPPPPPAPAIVMTKTVGLDSASCATSSNLNIPAGGGGTVVYYCYTVTNTGNVTLTTHDLVDSELGTLLSGYTGTLGISQTIDTVSVGLVVSANITGTTTNVATWTANFDAGEPVTATSSATVTQNAPTSVSLSGIAGDSTGTTPLMLAALFAVILGFGFVVRRKLTA